MKERDTTAMMELHVYYFKMNFYRHEHGGICRKNIRYEKNYYKQGFWEKTELFVETYRRIVSDLK